VTSRHQTLLVDRPSPGVVLATLNRPERSNALTGRVFRELYEVAEEVRADRTARVLLVAGAGDAFCAGYDLAEAAEFGRLSTAETVELVDVSMRPIMALHTLPQPVIALIGGLAVGGGLSLALAADLRIATPRARMSAIFVRIGLSAGDLGTSWLLPRLIGTGLAAELMYTGRDVDAEEAARIGLVNRVVPDGELLDAGLALAAQIAQRPAMGVRFSKRALRSNLEVPSFGAAMELEGRGQAMLLHDPDATAAIAAVHRRQEARRTP
jgi:enoyl-CoA hydratase/carnithine racemase